MSQVDLCVVQGVIPSAPDAWIWMGDMSYMDDPNINCDDFPTHSNCNCTADWLHIPPHGCNAGNLDHATLRMEVRDHELLHDIPR